MKPSAHPEKSASSFARATALLSLLVISLTACSTTPGLGSLSPEAARREARRDLASGHPRLYLAGTRGTSLVGVPQADLPLVRNLPVDSRLSLGCDDPLASAHLAYARAYNQEIVNSLILR